MPHMRHEGSDQSDERDRVLLVEDDEATVTVLRTRFEAAGFRVDHAADGYAAIDALKQHSYAVIVLDLVIHEGLNGFGVLNFLEMEQPAAIDRVFIISGMSEQTVAQTAPALLSRFYRKPFDDRKLVAAAQELVRPPEPEPQGDPRILIVDDDRMLRALVARVARAQGVASDTAENGRDAIDLLASFEYSAIVLDLVMPVLDGFAVLSFMAEAQPQQLRRTIVTTGLPQKYRQDIDTSRLCGVIEKPLDPQAVGSLIASCIAR